MDDLLWRFGFLTAVALLVWILHSWVDAYPVVLPKSSNLIRNIQRVFLLWGAAIVFPILMLYWISPYFDQAFSNRTLNQLVQVPLRSLAYFLLPFFLVVRPEEWTVSDMGLSIKNKSWSVTLFALLVGVGSGALAYSTGQSNISIQVLSLGELLILFYNNAFLEEFFHRGIIQSLLERSIGQGKAILWGGIMFGLTHLAFDVSMLMQKNGILVVFLALLMQTLAGWLFGITYMKTRSLWPGMVCHYLANWLPSILVFFRG